MDFEDLAFSGDGHFMANRKVQLPPGSQRNSFKVRPSHLDLSGMQRCAILHYMIPCFQLLSGAMPLV